MQQLYLLLAFGDVLSKGKRSLDLFLTLWLPLQDVANEPLLLVRFHYSLKIKIVQAAQLAIMIAQTSSLYLYAFSALLFEFLVIFSLSSEWEHNVRPAPAR